MSEVFTVNWCDRLNRVACDEFFEEDHVPKVTS